MSAHPRQFLVVLDCASSARAQEALRAAVGLGLRGDRVALFVRRTPPPSAAIDRALATLRKLGQEVIAGDDRLLAKRVRAADAVEVWR
jgi:hypothetical protein